MKSFFRHALQALILLMVALVSGLLAMRFAIHGREVAVPDLVGKTPVEARRVADASGFQFEVERQYYSPRMQEGRILSQLPPAGTKIRRGWQIRVAQSMGPQRMEIPNVLGQSQRAAELNIRRRGLDVGAVAQIQLSSAQADQVIAQDPAPSASSISVPKISLLAAQSPSPQAFVMPSFVGQTLGNVDAALKDAGLKIGTVTETAPRAESASALSPVPIQATSSSPASIIVSQSPGPGTKVVAGSAVNFEVR
ncbi:MAG TPA: PASTA domain-containing protein [Terriglobales bacterium]|nr:PASTA domain-containing protein [Terriglobales bacterium]